MKYILILLAVSILSACGDSRMSSCKDDVFSSKDKLATARFASYMALKMRGYQNPDMSLLPDSKAVEFWCEVQVKSGKY